MRVPRHAHGACVACLPFSPANAASAVSNASRPPRSGRLGVPPLQTHGKDQAVKDMVSREGGALDGPSGRGLAQPERWRQSRLKAAAGSDRIG